MSPDKQHDTAVPDRSLVEKESVYLLKQKNILTALQTFKTSTPEKEIAAEFVGAHVQFLGEIIRGDHESNLYRSDTEIRDLVSYVNMLMKKKDEKIFNAILMECPSHYKTILNKITQSDAQKK